MRLVDLDGIWDNKKRKFEEKIFSEDCDLRFPSDILSPLQIFLIAYFQKI